MIEVRKDVVGYEGYYEVSNIGNIRSKKKPMGIAKKYTPDGYVRVHLQVNKVSKYMFVHRIVLNTFIGDGGNLQSNHINGIRDDNRLDNLEWCTMSENMKHSYKYLGRKYKSPMKGITGSNHFKSKKVHQIGLDGEIIKERDSLMDVERELGILSSSISCVCNSVYGYKTAGGYKRKFIT